MVNKLSKIKIKKEISKTLAWIKQTQEGVTVKRWDIKYLSDSIKRNKAYVKSLQQDYKKL
jgi:hypothetical protein